VTPSRIVENVAMTRNEMQAFVDRWVRAWTTTDLEGLLACYDPHAELHIESKI